MPESIFHFKQFFVKQDLCAMKVGTDGVLLGAWIRVQESKRILDAGCGTGLITLMLAQRSNAFIDAIDIDESAFLQAKENINNSIWNNRLNTYQTSLQDHAHNSNFKYDVVVSNPPFFSNALRPGNDARAKARHNHLLPFSELIGSSWNLLSDNGSLSLILPYEVSHEVVTEALKKGFFIKRTCQVIPKQGKAPKRILIEFTKYQYSLKSDEILVIEKEKRHQYTEEYIRLTKDFYIKF